MLVLNKGREPSKHGSMHKEQAMIRYQLKPRGRPPLEGLSPALEKTLDVIKTFMEREGMSPTVYELADILQISAPSVHAQIVRLERKGYIQRTKGKTRSIELLGGAAKFARQVTLPVIGRVAAGLPILAVENIIGEIAVSSSDVRGECFALEVEGDSMIDVGIHEGDFLIVRRQQVAENGDIVVALLDDEATVKRLFIAGGRIELRPANTKYKPIPVGPDDRLLILGIVVAVSAKMLTKKL